MGVSIFGYRYISNKRLGIPTSCCMFSRVLVISATLQIRAVVDTLSTDYRAALFSMDNSRASISLKGPHEHMLDHDKNA